MLLPVYVPLVSGFINRWIAPLPFFRLFTQVNLAVARRRMPRLGPDDELIFVEGHSSDGTWEEIQRVVVRLGFAESRGDVLMILDADLSVPPKRWQSSTVR